MKVWGRRVFRVCVINMAICLTLAVNIWYVCVCVNMCLYVQLGGENMLFRILLFNDVDDSVCKLGDECG